MKPATCKSCDGHQSELRRRVLANNSMQIVYQCLKCGRSASNPLSKATVPGYLELPGWDDSLAGAYDKSRHEASLEKRADWFEEHNAYLRTPEWRGRRAAVIKRCKGICEGCAAAPVTQVHHLTYEHWQRELLWELVGVCDTCHEVAHTKTSTMVVGVPLR